VALAGCGGTTTVSKTTTVTQTAPPQPAQTQTVTVVKHSSKPIVRTITQTVNHTVTAPTPGGNSSATPSLNQIVHCVNNINPNAANYQQHVGNCQQTGHP
jgi:hypothetical protein